METHHIDQPSDQPSKIENPTVAKQQAIETDGEHQMKSANTPGEEPLPKISITWSLDPTTHSFSSSSAPTLRLCLINHATRPITIYNEYRNPTTLLAEGRFSIFDHTTNSEVAQLKTRFCDFEPPSKVDVPLGEKMFHNLPLGYLSLSPQYLGEAT